MTQKIIRIPNILKLMSQTKNLGFTFIELLVVTVIFISISTMAVAFLFSTLSGGGKAEAIKEVRQNGSYALSVMEKLIVSSRRVECYLSNPSTTLKITAIDNSIATISCVGGQIASGSGFLTADNVSVSACTFFCTVNPGVPATVEIQFTVSKAGVGFRPGETAEATFHTKLIVKNQRD